MKANPFLSGAVISLAIGSMLVGCESSSKPAAAKPDVMDLSDAPPPAPMVPPHVDVSTSPEATPAVAPAVPTATGPQKHVVVAKDTLYALAKQYYGDSKQWPKIVAANPGLVPEHMPVGKTIIIP